MYANGKVRPAETITGVEGGEMKENGGGMNSTMIYLTYYKNFCKRHNAYPHPAQQFKKMKL
jgi:hypothetical protein